MDDPNLIPGAPEGDALEEQISRSLVDSLSDDAPGAPDDAEDVLAALDGTLTELPETNKTNETNAPADGEPEQDAAQAVETVDETAESPSEPPQEDATEPIPEENEEKPAAVPAAPTLSVSSSASTSAVRHLQRRIISCSVLSGVRPPAAGPRRIRAARASNVRNVLSLYGNRAQKAISVLLFARS